MTNKEIIKRVQERIADKDEIEYEVHELVGYLNDTIDWFSMQLIGIAAPEMAKEISVVDGDTVPADYVSPCGIFPLEITGTTFRIVDGSPSVSLRYFASRPQVSFNEATRVYTPADSVFKSLYDSIIVQKTCIYALNRNEYDVSTDEALLKEMLQAVGVSQSA